jgi:hypothetical protein
MSLDILPSAPDVIAVRVQGQLEHDEMERAIDLIERSISANERTHVFVEAIGFRSLDMQHLSDYLRRTWPLLGKLKRFGRIAVVSDQAWLRAAARIESALLPNISYEVFGPSEREQALAWVEGRESYPHRGGIRAVETDRRDVFAFEIDGKLMERDLEAVADTFLAQAPSRAIGKIIRFGGAELGGLLDGDFVRMKLAAMSSVERYAIVGGPEWLAGWISLVDGLAKADIRHFALQEEAAAWEWVGAQPRSRGQASA